MVCVFTLILVCVLLFRETREGFVSGGESQPFFGEISGAGGPQGPASTGGVGVPLKQVKILRETKFKPVTV